MREDTQDQSQINLLTSLVHNKCGIRLYEMEYDSWAKLLGGGVRVSWPNKKYYKVIVYTKTWTQKQTEAI